MEADRSHDDGLTALITVAMNAGRLDYQTARTVIHTLHDRGLVKRHIGALAA